MSTKNKYSGCSSLDSAPAASRWRRFITFRFRSWRFRQVSATGWRSCLWLLHLHDVIQEDALHIFEPMGYSWRNDDHVIFGEGVGFSAFAARAAHLSRRRRFAIHHLAAGGECS